MKILLIISSFPSDNPTAGLFLPDFIDALVALGCEVRVLTQNCEANETVTRPFKNFTATFFAWRGGYTLLVNVLARGLRAAPWVLGYFFHGYRAGVRVAREWQPDFILAEWLIPSGVIAAAISKRTGIPFAARALGSDVMVAGRKPLLRPVVKYVARQAVALFADGFELCRLTSELADGKPCHFAATSRRLGSQTSGFQFDAPDGCFTTLTVGRLHRSKGQDVLIAAAAALKAQGVALRCYLVGVGEDREALERQIEARGVRGEVILAGRLEDGDIALLLKSVDCVVIPSRSDSIPLVFSEAVSAGKPLVVTDVGDMGDLVRKYDLGRVVPAEQPQALADALAAQARAFQSLGEEARHQVVHLLSNAQAAETILEQMRQALNLKRTQVLSSTGQ